MFRHSFVIVLDIFQLILFVFNVDNHFFNTNLLFPFFLTSYWAIEINFKK